MQNNKKPIVGISIGDINGIGPEIILNIFRDYRMFNYCIPVVFACKNLINFYIKHLNINDLNYNIAKDFNSLHPKKINLMCFWQNEIDLRIDVGKSTEMGGVYALKSLEAAVAALKEKQIDTLVTAPINKKNIQSEEFKFPGHTEFLQNTFEVSSNLMLMVGDHLKVAVQTGHIPLKKVSETITLDGILNNLSILNNCLQSDFMINNPNIAVLGLNPHAGDNGLLGDEENDVIIPAIEAAKSKGILAHGPFPGDGFFGSGMYQQFDATLAMYHDQGLAPFKALTFDEGVNYTAGMPIIRTSPAHGTGYNIAGQNVANLGSFREAIFLSIKILNNRIIAEEITKNPLKTKLIREKEE